MSLGVTVVVQRIRYAHVRGEGGAGKGEDTVHSGHGLLPVSSWTLSQAMMPA